MWKLVVGFIAFAALALFVIMKGGDKLDMGGEKHDAGIGGDHPPAASAPAPAAAPPAAAPSAPASAASS